MYIKRENDYLPMEDDLGEGSSSDPYIRISGVTNENWRGKNDPTERRRIQNRLNQRAFRQRQRAGESPKQYKPRSVSSGPDEDSFSSPPPEEAQPSIPIDEEDSASNQPSGQTDSFGRVWDELARLINRNLMAAAATNAKKLGIDMDSLRSGAPALTPQLSNNAVPTALQPVQLQYQIPHDLIIDIIPHPRLRFNILRAIATQQLDGTAFSKHLRASGALQCREGQWQRGGLIVWSSPEQLASWELSELFLRTCGSFLLPGCEDLLAATNAWRGRRGERPFPASIPS